MRNKPIILPRPAPTALLLGALTLLLVLGSFTGQVLKYRWGVEHAFGAIAQLDVDSEHNLSAWAASSLLLISAVLLGLIAHNRPDRGESWYWRGLSAIFMLLSADEAASLHELLGNGLRNRWHLDGYLHYAWVVIGIPFALLVLAIYLPLLRRLSSHSRNLLLVAGAMYCSGALVVEMIGGHYATLYGQLNVTFAAIAHIEELLEFLGVVVFIYALLDLLAAPRPGSAAQLHEVSLSPSSLEISPIGMRTKS